MRDVFGVAIGEIRPHDQLLRLPGFRQKMPGQNLDALDARLIGLGPGRAGGDPFGQNLVINRTDFKTFSALVRDRAGRFEQHQAAAWIARHDAATQGAARQREIIALVIVAAQGEFETVLARRRAVAGARAATGLGQHRLDVIAKTPLERLVHVLHGDRGQGGLFSDGRTHRGAAVPQRPHDAIFNLEDIRVADCERYAVGQLPAKIFP